MDGDVAEGAGLRPVRGADHDRRAAVAGALGVGADEGSVALAERAADLVVVNPAVRPDDPFLTIGRAAAAALGKRLRAVIRMPAAAYCVDNAAMTAGLAYHHLRAGRGNRCCPAGPSAGWCPSLRSASQRRPWPPGRC